MSGSFCSLRNALMASRFMCSLILPTNDGHPVKRVNYATEVTHDQADRIQENHPEAVLA